MTAKQLASITEQDLFPDQSHAKTKGIPLGSKGMSYSRAQR
jgi:hypothetical protein